LSDGGYIQHGRRHSPRGGSDRIPGIPVTVYGGVDGSTGDPSNTGSGDWSSVTDFAGEFTITFDPPFADVPAVVVSENETSTVPPNHIQKWSVTEDTLVVKTYDITGALVDDTGFDFIAHGSA